MLIKGIQKTTLVDYPGKIASIIFVGGCDFRCPFCYNKDLVVNYRNLPTIAEEEVLAFLKKRKKYLEGVVVTGGEPTIYKDLPKFLAKIKKLGLLVKLDTNGSNPKMLEELIKRKLADYVAMDVKSSLEKYKKAAGTDVNLSDIKKSAKIIKNSKIDYEFRTTAVPGLFSKQELEKIGKWLKGAKKYYIQQFVPMESCINPELAKQRPFTNKELQGFRKMGEKYFSVCELRGV